MLSKRAILIFTLPIIYIIILYGPISVFANHHYDDSYITYRFAVNLAEGKGLVFNVGERVNSASALIYTLLLSLTYELGLTNVELSSIVISLLSVGGVSHLLYKIIFKDTKSSALATFLSLLAGAHGLISGWAVSGMETALFTFLVLVFIYQYFYKKNLNWPVFLTTMIAILLIRTEGVILLGVWGVFELYETYINKSKPSSKFLAEFFIFALTLILFYKFQLEYYGSFTTNAYDFKKIAAYYQPDPVYIVLVWGCTSLFLSLLAVYSLFICRDKKTLALCVYLLLSFLSLFVGPFSDGARYSVHLLPIVFILSAISIKKILDWKRYKLFLLVYLLIFFQTLFSTLFVRHFMLNTRKGQLCRREMGEFLAANLTREDYVLSGDIGMVAYIAKDVNFIDLGGLTSKEVLDQYKNGQIFDEVVLNKRPKLLADTFYKNESGVLEHPILENQIEFIKGMTTYTKLQFSNTFNDVVYECSDDRRVYAVVNLKNLYEKIQQP